MLGNGLAERVTGYVGNDARTHFASVGIDDRQHRSLVRLANFHARGNGLVDSCVETLPVVGGFAVTVLRVTTDPRFVGHDGAAQHVSQRTSLGRFPDPVHHESGGSVCDSESAVNLVRGHPVLVRGEHVERGEPLGQGDFGVLEDAPDEDAELALAGLALPDPAIGNSACRGGPVAVPRGQVGGSVNLATVGALGAIRPPKGLHQLPGRCFVVKVGGKRAKVHLHAPIFAGGCNAFSLFRPCFQGVIQVFSLGDAISFE